MKGEPIVTKCCQCGRIRVNCNWVPEPAFLSSGVRHTHTFCPACLERALRECEGLERKRRPVETPAPVEQPA